MTLVVPARGLGYPHLASGDGRIYVYSDDGLISLRDDGTDRRTHVKVTGPGRAGAPRPPAADAVLMRPDGTWALASVNNQLWLVAVPPYTARPPPGTSEARRCRRSGSPTSGPTTSGGPTKAGR